MSEDSDSISEEERSLFRPFTRESLAAIEARIAEELAKQKELEKKRAEGEVWSAYSTHDRVLLRLFFSRRVTTSSAYYLSYAYIAGRPPSSVK